MAEWDGNTLLEDGANILLEDGGQFLLEDAVEISSTIPIAWHHYRSMNP